MSASLIGHSGSSAHCGNLVRPMSQVGLGRVKTPALAAHVETSRSNCISESQIILHTRGLMPCWRIVFSTFGGCMSFYTARVTLGHSAMSAQCPVWIAFRTQVGRLPRSELCRYYCKSLFALVTKNSPGCRRDFRVKM